MRARAEALDAADPLAPFRGRFLSAPGVVAYLDGNSLGRPVASVPRRLEEFVRGEWGAGLIRGWTDDGPSGPWMEWPERVGDRIAAAALGAAPGQTVVADSTTVLLYKLARAAVDDGLAAGRDEIVLDTDNFPTDRYVLEGIAAERGARLRWVETDPAAGITDEQVAAVVGPRTALALFSHVAYRSGWVADAPAITRTVHDAGGLVLWDLSHSAGSVEVGLDAWDADLAVGCTYKYLGGGPGSPAFATSPAPTTTGCASPCRAGWGAPTRSRWARATGPRPACAASSAGPRRSWPRCRCSPRWTCSTRPGSPPCARSRGP